MTRSPARILAALLCLLACSALPVPPVTAWDPCADWDYPQIDFTFAVLPAETFPVTVQFNGTYSTRSDEPIPSLTWDFGDGTTETVYSADRAPGWLSPRRSYATLRDHYTVCLSGSTICGREGRRCHDVAALCTAPVAGFTFDVDEGPAPLAVRVTDTSEHTPGDITSWVYTKTGNPISFERDFAGTFTEPGTFTIIQTVKKNCNPASDSFYRAVHVQRPRESGSTGGTGITTTITPDIAIVGMYFNVTSTTSVVPTTGNASALFRAPALPPTLITPTPAGGTGTITTTVPVSGSDTVPGTGILSVSTEPPGAEVYVDNVLRGASPASIPGLSAGSHSLTIVKQGYTKLVVPVQIDQGRTTEYSTALVPSTGGAPPLPVSPVTVFLAIGCAAGCLALRTGTSR